MREERHGFVLAGGESRRMGRQKATLLYQGQTLVDRALALLESLDLKVTLLGPPHLLERPRVAVLPDRSPGQGPLGALWTALLNSQARYHYLLPCDTPLVCADLYRAMFELEGQWDVIVPRDSQGRLHPACAGYTWRCRAPVGALLSRGERRLEAVFDLEGLRAVALETGALGIPDSALLNVNTPDDLRRLARFTSRESVER